MKEELLNELDGKFAVMKKELGFKASLEELDGIFFLRDLVLKEGFVSGQVSRMLCSRIVDMYMSWANYLHGFIIPNSGSMINLTESQIFNDAEKAVILSTFNKILALVSANTLNGLTKDKKAEARFVDDSVSLWNELNPKLQQIIKRVNTAWVEHAALPPEQDKPE